MTPEEQLLKALNETRNPSQRLMEILKEHREDNDGKRRKEKTGWTEA
jgi:hypothetical protein